MQPEKLFRIGEVMEFSGLTRQTVHNYTQMGLITEQSRTKAGHRLYPESVFDRIQRINMLKRHRTLREVKEMLEGDWGRKGNGETA